MPRVARVIAVGLPHHITQRGNGRRDVFLSDSLRQVYLDLLREHAARNRLRIIGYCVMTNHLHLVAIPGDEASMANTFRHAHARFAQYWNTEFRTVGHLWQNRYYSCPVEEQAAERVLAYVENNPARTGMVRLAADFRWSSARAHVEGKDESGCLDMDWWRDRGADSRWRKTLETEADRAEERDAIRQATFTGRPYGSAEFVAEMEKRLDRNLRARRGGRPKNAENDNRNQMELWGIA